MWKNQPFMWINIQSSHGWESAPGYLKSILCCHDPGEAMNLAKQMLHREDFLGGEWIFSYGRLGVFSGPKTGTCFYPG